MTRCSRCITILPEEDALCQACKDYKPVTVNWKEKTEELKVLTEQFKGKRYDAIVTLTGGKDSSFALYYLTKILGLKVLCVTWDNGLIRESAWKNMQNCVDATKSEHYIFKWNEEATLQTLRGLFFNFSRVCYCPAFMAIGTFPLAIRENIPLIFTGFSEGQREQDHSFTMPDQSLQKEKLIKFYYLWKTMIEMSLEKADKDNKERYTSEILKELKACIAPDRKNEFCPIMVPLANYVDWSDMEKLEQILATIGWKNPNDAYVHSSCIIEPIKGYLEAKRNLTEVTMELSQMVRSGSLTREQGLDEIKIMHMSNDNPPDLRAFCEFLKINEKEFFFYADNREKLPQKIECRGEQVDIKVFSQDMIDSVSWIMGIERHTAIFQ